MYRLVMDAILLAFYRLKLAFLKTINFQTLYRFLIHSLHAKIRGRQWFTLCFLQLFNANIRI